MAQVVWLPLAPDDTLALINVHLEAWDVPIRQAQARYLAQLADSLRATYSVILAGDFNAMPPAMTTLFIPDSSLQYLLDKGFTPVGWEPGQSGAWPLTYSSEQPRVSIDHVFIDTNQFQILSSRIVSEMGTVSDHLPVWVELLRNK